MTPPAAYAMSTLLLAAAAIVVPAPLPLRHRTVGARGTTIDPRRRRAMVVGGGLGAAALLLLPSAPHVALGLAVVGSALGWWLPMPVSAADRAQHRADLGLVLELWAAGLAGGLAPGAALDSALTAAARQDVPQLAVLFRAAALLRLGADAERAWAGAELLPELAPVAAAARRSAVSGAELTTVVREQAAALRRAGVAETQRRSARAMVLMAAPLGLCFLPAFICLGLAPVVIALLDTLSIGR